MPCSYIVKFYIEIDDDEEEEESGPTEVRVSADFLCAVNTAGDHCDTLQLCGFESDFVKWLELQPTHSLVHSFIRPLNPNFNISL